MTEIQYLKPHPEAPHTYTDGGRKASGLSGEQLDCTVRAFAIARDVPYIEAHAELSRLGRPSGRGFKFRIVQAKRPDLFSRTELTKGKRKRVSTLLRTLKTGRHVLRIHRHVFAVVDGVVHDNVSFNSLKNCVVTDIYTAI